MERDICLHWPALVEEARRRRKALGLSQRRLAGIDEISTPTVSRFESGDKNIQLASMLAILYVLGLVRKPSIQFAAKQGRYDRHRDAVLFLGRTNDGEVQCTIDGEALDMCFGSANRSQRARLAAFRTHRLDIQALARRKLDAGIREADGSIAVRTTDCEEMW